ncbi:hypothetical protein N7G274_002500 [Stereocaulon virgatum]|uniref:Uncharacterized protein n=1 Tax=Stereocaulon virgatum TaxID=373712 RepID=A0ABR4AGT7_9LECA
MNGEHQHSLCENPFHNHHNVAKRLRRIPEPSPPIRMPSPTCHPAMPCRSSCATTTSHTSPPKRKPCFVYRKPDIWQGARKEKAFNSSRLTSLPKNSRSVQQREMASIMDGLSNLLSSIFEIFQGLINTVLSALQSVFGLFRNLIASVFDMMSGLVGFILGNIVIIGVLVAAFVGYSAYTQKNRGGGITGGKKKM